jgi:hypothetical protein
MAAINGPEAPLSRRVSPRPRSRRKSSARGRPSHSAQSLLRLAWRARRAARAPSHWLAVNADSTPSLRRPPRRSVAKSRAPSAPTRRRAPPTPPSSAAGAQYALIQAVSAAVTFMAPQTVFEELSELKEPQEHVIPPCMSERLSAHSTTRRICRIGLPVTNARAGLTGVTGLSNRTTMM